MFAFGYALVPIYSVFCKATGLNGKTNNVADVASLGVDESRIITVTFLATNNQDLPWEFRPETISVKVHPGESKQVAYYAKNKTGKTMTVQAIPSVSPGLAAKYLKKTECFCFKQQTFKAGQAMDMPLIFHLDRNIPKSVRYLTLSYTLFYAGNVKPRKKNIGKIS